MKSLIVVFSIVVLAFFTVPAAAQHSAHHPDQAATVQSDSTTGMMKGGMMSGGMMGGQSMMQGGMMSGMMGSQARSGKCPMCGKMMKGGMMKGGMMGNMMSGGMRGGMMDGHSMMKKQMMLINKLPGMQEVLSLTDSQVEKLQQMQNGFQKKQIDLKASLAKKKIDLNTVIDKDAPASDIRSAMKEMADIKINIAVQAYETADNMKNVLNADQKKKLKDKKSGGMMGGGMMQ